MGASQSSSSQPPLTTRTTSTCTPATSRGAHAFTVSQHGLVRMTVAAGRFVRSGTFAVGGHDWAVRYYPNGVAAGAGAGEDDRAPAVLLELVTTGAVASALYELSVVVDQSTGARRRLLFRTGKPAAFDTKESLTCCHGVRFTGRRALGSSPEFVREDRLTIECVVTVVGEMRVSETKIIMQQGTPPLTPATFMDGTKMPLPTAACCGDSLAVSETQFAGEQEVEKDRP